jgi:hypothetical protein
MSTRRVIASTVSLALAVSATLHAQPAPTVRPAERQASTEVGRYRLQSNPWVNLHQRLMYEARFEDAAPASLSGDDLAAWKKAAAAYRVFLGKRSPIFDDQLIALNATLSASHSAELPAGVPDAAAAALRLAMPLYRAAQWPEDDRANRFWIAVAEPLLASAAEELAEAHARVYGVPFPRHILVDVASHAWEFGAYTVGERESAHAVISSLNTDTQCFGALESLMHEPSHAIVAPRSGAIGADLDRAARELHREPPHNLWHAILFYTSGELTRRALAARGVKYQPFMIGMYERGFRGFKQALETHWQAYLDGKVSREEAIRQIVMETSVDRPAAGHPGHP